MNAACGAKTSNGKEAMFEELHRKMNAFWNNDRTLSQTIRNMSSCFPTSLTGKW